ncbi:Gfo/Idh/MocA family protein [Bdellovibrio sp. BCCA]|uniref:Gfo/Idh/MocA family protein n=1 Tax=Bdellovibrio sp. BCCA TaxID=3136281 RepID=UPI0030F2A34E
MSDKKIRYAVVGLGNIAQVAVLPAFKGASANSELTALVSGDDDKLKTLGKKYKVKNLYNYRDFDKCLHSGEIDAVYIATPNVNHHGFAVEAARAGIHILTEKPMALTEDDCISMLEEAEDNNVKLMVAYRLHFDPANLQAIETARNGKLGELRIFNSTFTYQVTDPNNIRLKYDMGGGPLYDIGTYCINAARYLFQDEPVEVFATALSNPRDERFSEVEEMAAVTLRFRKARLANFVVSFGAAATAAYDLIGSEGSLRLEHAYEYADDMKMTTTIDEKDTVKRFKKHDQFAPEIEYFSKCILNNEDPEPSALEGLYDIRIINAIFESARTKRSVKLDYVTKKNRPDIGQSVKKPAHGKPETIHAPSPHD